MTIIGLLLGLCLQGLMDLRGYRQAGKYTTLAAYLAEKWVDISIGSLVGAAFWLGLPELYDAAPDLARAIGLKSNPTYLSSLVCGMFGNYIASFFSHRIRALFPGA